MAVFHQGELALQQKAGVKDKLGPIGEAYIRDYLPLQHQQFFTQQKVLFAGLTDDQGHPWASPIIVGQGFIQSPNPQTLVIEARVLLEYSRRLSVDRHDHLALLGLDFASRRRNRVNGVVSYSSPSMLRLEVKQSFGNCPKYIQQRQVHWRNGSAMPKAEDFSELAIDDTYVQSLIEGCDTLFIASRSKALTPSNGGVDVSHRGGKAGFARYSKVLGLVIPDFSGNSFFNTLGNIYLDSRVGLYLPDFNSANSLWLKGQAKIETRVPRAYRYRGAQRYLLVQLEQALRLANQGLLQSGQSQLSPALLDTGD
ncbi:pyridoxamine 5'-phosphate oxidase family protein [Agarivorans sp.]|uniref:pyridoxamine 5'-phosphate oxidase family protein n=1 Tax=Agarivorans sp. TaxID=1872412 RepID=UPI003CFD970E